MYFKITGHFQSNFLSLSLSFLIPPSFFCLMDYGDHKFQTNHHFLYQHLGPKRDFCLRISTCGSTYQKIIHDFQHDFQTITYTKQNITNHASSSKFSTVPSDFVVIVSLSLLLNFSRKLRVSASRSVPFPIEITKIYLEYEVNNFLMIGLIPLPRRAVFMSAYFFCCS